MSSKIPVLSRSNSQSSIPLRQSRSSVRKPSQGVQPRARSLASKSPSSNFLRVPYRFGKSRSTINLKDASTPVNVRRDVTPRSVQQRMGSAKGASVKDTRPINDRDWQHAQIARIKSCLLQLDPNVPSLKPLTTVTFVFVTNLLLSKFDDRISITMENYKEEVVRYLKIYGYYPGALKPSLMKNISAPHEFSKIVAMWSWLVERIEILQSPIEALLRPDFPREKFELYQLWLSYNVRKYFLWNNGETEDVADEELASALREHYNIADVNIDEKRAELEKLRAKVKCLEEKKAKTVDGIENVVEETRRERERNQAYLRKREDFFTSKEKEKSEALQRLAVVEEMCKTQDERRRSMKKRIAAQKYSQADIKHLQEKIDKLRHTVKLHQDRLDERKNLITTFDLQFSETKMKLETTIHARNNQISKLSLIRPELKELKIREKGFLKSDMIESLNEVINKKNAFDEQLKREFQEIEEEYKKVMAKNVEQTLEMDVCTKKLKGITLENEELENQLKALNSTNEAKISKAKEKVEKLTKILATLEKDSVAALIEQQERVAKWAERHDILKKKLEDHIANGREFFANIANSILKTAAAQTFMQERITDAIFEASKPSAADIAIATALGLPLPEMSTDQQSAVTEDNLTTSTNKNDL